MYNKLFKYNVLAGGVLLILSFLLACNNNMKSSEDQGLSSKKDILSGTYKKCWTECNPELLRGTKPGHNSSCCKTVFFSDHRIEVFKEGALNKTGMWCFNSDSTELEVQFDGEFSILKILELSDEKLHYTYIQSRDTLEAVFIPET